jgi:asparagine synthase (glutamine-hydrolysing)
MAEPSMNAMMFKSDTASGNAAEEKSFMSVQAGIWNYEGQPAAKDFLAKIGSELAEYGPDGQTTYFDDSVGMLFRPYYTTSESRQEVQPHVFVSGRVFTWDGRLDNRDELQRDLHNVLSDNHTDLAIVEAAFDRWGTDCFAKLIGDWALSIWDPQDRKLILARDFAGSRHLFYYPKPKSVVWCTHLEPLAVCGDQFTLSDDYFGGYLALWPEAHLTPYREMHSVPPGKFVSIRNRTINVTSFWTFNPHFKTRYKTDGEYEEHFRDLLRSAVRRRLRTDSPILSDLSGGLDSSSIVCMADDILAREGAETPSVDTLSVFVRDEPSEEDSRYIAAIETKRGRLGHHIEIAALGDTSPFEYHNFVAAPSVGDRPEVEAAARNIRRRGSYRVLLSGVGGDEMLGQALDPRVQLADQLRQLRLVELTKQLRVWSILLRRPWIHLFVEALFLQLPASARPTNSETAKVDSWVNVRFARRQKLSARQSSAAEGPWFWLPSVRDWFQTLMTLTRQMTHTRPVVEETRYPYLDRNLVEFLVSIPTEQLLRPGQRRSLMRRGLVGILPPEILGRRTKSMGGRYFSIALAKYWSTIEVIVNSSFISRMGYAEQAEFRVALRDVVNGHLHAGRLLRALFWELWLRTVITEGIVGQRIVLPTLSRKQLISQP